VNRSKTQKKEWVAQPNLNVGMNVVEHRLSLLHSVSGFFFFSMGMGGLAEVSRYNRRVS
jgi:hypothetical protein